MCAGNLVPRNDEKELLVDPQVQSSNNPLQDLYTEKVLTTLAHNELGYVGGAGMGSTKQAQFALAAKFVGSDAVSQDDTIDFEYAPGGPEDSRRAREALLACLNPQDGSAQTNDTFVAAVGIANTGTYILTLDNDRRLVFALYADVPEDVLQWMLEDVVVGRLRRMVDVVAARQTAGESVVAEG